MLVLLAVTPGAASTMVSTASPKPAAATRPLLSPSIDKDRLPFAGTAILAEAHCDAKWKPFKTLERASVIHFPNDPAYETYQGVDLEPEHEPWPEDHERRGFSKVMGLVENQKAGDYKMAAEAGLLVAGETGKILVGECTAKSTNGTWHTQRIGPLKSTGGYDWHQFSWVDPGFVTSAFPAGGGAASFLGHFTGPVDADGKSGISNPPLHQHHVHVVPNPNDVYLNLYQHWTARRMLVIHGDWSFDTLGEGPLFTSENAMGQMYGSYQKLLNQKPSLNGEINDMRPRGSPEMTFYYQISLLIASPKTLQTATVLSMFKTHNGRSLLTMGGHNAATFTFASYIDRDSHEWYSNVWPFQGRMVGVWAHFHQSTHQESFLFASTPSILGISEAAGTPLDEIPTGNNAYIRSTVMERAEPIDALICTAKGRAKPHVEGYTANSEAGACFDRAAYPVCFEKEWMKDEPYTILSLTGPTADCGKALAHNPPYLPKGASAQHSIWLITMVATHPSQAGTSLYPVLVGSILACEDCQTDVATRFAHDATTSLMSAEASYANLWHFEKPAWFNSQEPTWISLMLKRLGSALNSGDILLTSRGEQVASQAEELPGETPDGPRGVGSAPLPTPVLLLGIGVMVAGAVVYKRGQRKDYETPGEQRALSSVPEPRSAC